MTKLGINRKSNCSTCGALGVECRTRIYCSGGCEVKKLHIMIDAIDSSNRAVRKGASGDRLNFIEKRSQEGASGSGFNFLGKRSREGGQAEMDLTHNCGTGARPR